MVEKKKCFIITPIGDKEAKIRRHIDGIIDQGIVPALREKYYIDVAHRNYEIGSINDRVIRSIYEADLVIANLTGINPNVMFELAIRYSFGKPALVIAEEVTNLPFDINDENVIFYINDPTGAYELKEKIIEFESKINFEKKDYGPVFKAVNAIPLYREVESGENVSSEKLLSYVIDRLDSIEKTIGKPNDETKERLHEITIEFEFEDKVDSTKQQQILNILIAYREVMSVEYKTDNMVVVQMITSNGKMYIREWEREVIDLLENIGVKCSIVRKQYNS